MSSSFWLDTHVHIQSSLDLDRMLDSAYFNFSRYCPEKTAADSFALFLNALPEQNLSEMLLLGAEDRKWQLQRDGAGMKAQFEEQQMYLLLGEQIVSSDGIEVLVLGEPPFLRDHGASAKQILSSIQHGFAVLPWGFGKWLGRRGRIINSLLQEWANEMSLFVGDIPARTKLLGGSSQFKKAAEKSIPLLRGTDPLPMAGEIERVGSYGTRVSTSKSYDNDFAIADRILDALKELPAADSQSEVKVKQFGSRLALFENLRAQIQLRTRP